MGNGEPACAAQGEHGKTTVCSHPSHSCFLPPCFLLLPSVPPALIQAGQELLPFLSGYAGLGSLLLTAPELEQRSSRQKEAHRMEVAGMGEKQQGSDTGIRCGGRTTDGGQEQACRGVKEVRTRGLAPHPHCYLPSHSRGTMNLKQLLTN